MKYAIMHATLCGWEHWGHIEHTDGTTEPLWYDTREEAQAEIEEFLADIKDEIRSGEREFDEGYEAEEFAIVEFDSDDAELQESEQPRRAAEMRWQYHADNDTLDLY